MAYGRCAGVHGRVTAADLMTDAKRCWSRTHGEVTGRPNVIRKVHVSHRLRHPSRCAVGIYIAARSNVVRVHIGLPPLDNISFGVDVITVDRAPRCAPAPIVFAEALMKAVFAKLFLAHHPTITPIVHHLWEARELLCKITRPDLKIEQLAVSRRRVQALEWARMGLGNKWVWR